MIVAEPTLRQQYQAARAQHDELESLLYQWKLWMQTGGKQDFKVKSRSVGQGYRHYDPDLGSEIADLSIARAVDKIIETLKPIEQLALHCEYLGAYWRSETPLHLVLVLARDQVRQACVSRGLLTPTIR